MGDCGRSEGGGGGRPLEGTEKVGGVSSKRRGRAQSPPSCWRTWWRLQALLVGSEDSWEVVRMISNFFKFFSFL